MKGTNFQLKFDYLSLLGRSNSSKISTKDHMPEEKMSLIISRKWKKPTNRFLRAERKESQNEDQRPSDASSYIEKSGF